MGTVRAVAGAQVADLRTVELEPTWRGEPTVMTYAFLAEEPDPADLLAVHDAHADAAQLRVISPDVLGWSAVFNPLFHAAVEQAGGPAADIGRRRRIRLAGDGATDDELVVAWLQSTVFLAAVTLSAALIQRRCSPGTLASKYDRLWQAGTTSRGRPGLEAVHALGLTEAVTALAADPSDDDVERLLGVRHLFDRVVHALSVSVPAEPAVMSATSSLPAGMGDRFGFVDELRELAGPGTQALIVYGSSVTGPTYADYDLVLVVDDAPAVLRRLAGVNPTWHGKELNLGVYDRASLWAMQLLSGDNLATYGRCLFGEVEVPVRSAPLLLQRNLSFGMVRLRQQLGMLGAAQRDPFPVSGDDRANLYGYFAKVPANVARGTFGVGGAQLDKATVAAWMAERCGFDVAAALAQVAAGRPAEALASAAVASMEVLRQLNEELGVVEPDPVEPADPADLEVEP